MPICVAKIAVSAATYSIDRPYDYLVPDALLPSVSVGTRVSIPFGKGNKSCEGIVLALRSSSDWKALKSIQSVLDPENVLDESQ